MDLEQRLRDSLAAREPGEDFEAAVLAKLQQRAQQTAQQDAPAPRRRISWRIPAALAATALAAAVGVHWAEEQRVTRNQEQLLLALAITSYELNQMQQRLIRNDTSPVQENGT
jgi:hypothetical protein